MAPRSRLTELSFYLLVLAFALLLLWHSLQLRFVMHGTVGPGLYPTIALGLLVVVTVALLVRTFLARDVRVLSPFIEGLDNDSLLKRLSDAAGALFGRPLRVSSRPGSGVFSALHGGLRSPPDGATLVVVSSETSDAPNLEAAAFALANFEPVARLYFDPDVLVVRRDSPWGDLAAFLGDRPSAPMAVGIAHHPDLPSPSSEWLRRHGAFSLAARYDEDPKVLLNALRRGELDAVVAVQSVVAEDLAEGTFRALGAMTEESGAGGVPTFAEQGHAFASGNWAGLALPKGADAECGGDIRARLYRSFAEAFRRELAAKERPVQAERWRITSPSAFADFLARLDGHRRALGGAAQAPPLARGKIAGLVIAIAATLAFPYAMELLGFPIAAFVFLAGLMTVLWPRLNQRALLQILPVSAGIAYFLYYVFWNIFYVVFPEGALTGM